MSKKYKAWTAEEIELLKSLMDKGEKTSVIAIRLQRPHGSVNVKKREIESGNLRSCHFWTVEELKMLKALLQKDLSKKQIAEIMGRSESSIKNRLIRMGIDIWNENSYQAYVC
nr:MAG TPA: Myb2 [Caudoviricetes sp.]